ncbi:hypothetical protein SLEP1_g42245 [Rubroshorea leprosula]|uniref:Uncharacterized protein n=1 Tax=Rubroshorea leprosula TaxID=152421 RepID=A0AAV5L9A5_9ROSI|nr:hypothetical protein SLEP1_g42245 [Rubroshorea leprosula]
MLSRHASSGVEVEGIVAQSCSHRHTGGVCSVQGTYHVASRSARTDMRIGVSTITSARESAIGSVDAGMCTLETQGALPAEASISGRGMKLRMGHAVACVSSRGRRAWARESVLARDTGTRMGKMGRGVGTHGCGMARGTGACEHKHGSGRERNMERSGGGPCIIVSMPMRRTRGAQNILEAVGHAKKAPDKGLDGLVGPSPTWVTPRAL